MGERSIAGSPDKGTTQGGQPSDVPGGHPARLNVMKDEVTINGMQVEFLPPWKDESWNALCILLGDDNSEVEPDGREDRQSD